MKQEKLKTQTPYNLEQLTKLGYEKVNEHDGDIIVQNGMHNYVMMPCKAYKGTYEVLIYFGYIPKKVI